MADADAKKKDPECFETTSFGGGGKSALQSSGGAGAAVDITAMSYSPSGAHYGAVARSRQAKASGPAPSTLAVAASGQCTKVLASTW